jgi:uncharacterized membrane protein YesL
MGMFSKYHAWRNRPGKGVDGPPPDKGAARFAFILKTHFLKLVTLNLLFLAFCIPVLTIPAALSGMTRVLMRLVREGICDLWQDFWKEFKTDFAKRLLAGLAFTSVPAVAAILPAFLIAGTPTTGLWLTLAAVSFMVQGYLFPLLVIVDLPAGANIRNAFALCVLEWKKSLLLLLTAGGIQVLCYFFFPVSAPLMLLFSFSVSQLIVCVIVNEPITRHVIREKAEAETEA